MEGEEDEIKKEVGKMYRDWGLEQAFGWRVIRSGVLVSHGVMVGFDRVMEEEEELSIRWHWGSCAKALLSSLCAILVDRGSLRWDTRLVELDSSCGSFVGECTVEQVLAHRSGIVEDFPEDVWRALAEKEKEQTLTPVEGRRLYCEHLRNTTSLAHAPGLCYGPYSNAAYTLLAHALETKLGSPFETMVEQMLCTPLGIKGGCFGIPKGGPLCGHDQDGKPVGPQVQDASFHIPPLGFHSTLEEWGKFALLWQQALGGDTKPLTSVLGISHENAIKVITAASPVHAEEKEMGSEPCDGYSLGWKRTFWDGGNPNEQDSYLWHFGTNFAYQAGICIEARRGVIILLASNTGHMVTRLVMRMIQERILELFD